MIPNNIKKTSNDPSLIQNKEINTQMIVPTSNSPIIETTIFKTNKKRKKSSWIYPYYSEIESGKYQCIECKNNGVEFISENSTGHLIYHQNKLHGIFEDNKKKEKKNLTLDQKKSIQKAFLKVIVTDSRPLSMFESSSFHSLFDLMSEISNINFTCPCDDTIKSELEILQFFFEEFKGMFKK